MRVGVDVHIAAKANRRGVPHYVTQIVSRLVSDWPREDWQLLHVGTDAAGLPELLTNASSLTVIERRRATSSLMCKALRRSHHRSMGDLDVMFLPAPSPTVVDKAVPVVLTVHDTLHVTGRRHFGLRHRAWLAITDPSAQIKAATLLLANSEHTRTQLLATADVEENRVRVVPHGVDDHYFAQCPSEELESVLHRHNLRPGYVLHVGTIEPRKNLGVLIEAIRRLSRSAPDLRLVLAGGHGERSDEVVRAALSAEPVAVIGMVDDADKRALYAGAAVYCSPSHDEGLGLTPLEALAAGTPSVVSDIPAFNETLGRDGAVFVSDRENPSAVAHALDLLLHDTEQRERILSMRGRILERYRWAACANATYIALADAADINS